MRKKRGRKKGETIPEGNEEQKPYRSILMLIGNSHVSSLCSSTIINPQNVMKKENDGDIFTILCTLVILFQLSDVNSDVMTDVF